MRQSYNSFKYWEEMANKNQTIRGHMFMNQLPTPRSLFIHTLIFTKKSGIDNIYAYFPDAKVLLGYIQYSFLQEAFFKWIYGGDKLITQIPSITVEKLIKTSLNEGRITKEVAKDMKECYEKVERMWDIPHNRILPELIKFARNFNKKWFGNNKRFLYLKVFEDAKSLGDFVVKSILMIENEENFKNKIGVEIDEWKEICKEAINNDDVGVRFREILQKSLTEVL